MPDSKNAKWASDFTDAEAPPKAPEPTVEPRRPAANDADGWQQYRHWISKAPAPKTRRAGIDKSLYTWKGYRNWTESVKRNWLDNREDSD